MYAGLLAVSVGAAERVEEKLRIFLLEIYDKDFLQFSKNFIYRKFEDLKSQHISREIKYSCSFVLEN